MKDYTVFVDGTINESRPGSNHNFQIAICPFSRSASAMAVKEYPTREALAADLRKYLGFTDAGIEGYFAQPDLRQALVHPLSDEVAAYFGWN
ncbi:MAG: hypothetical protein ABSF70_08005 [Terracidiphilus sp.]|jgi:hypothetical protein